MLSTRKQSYVEYLEKTREEMTSQSSRTGRCGVPKLEEECSKEREQPKQRQEG